eukprot:700460-Prorocentrum_minimum.AAC.2
MDCLGAQNCPNGSYLQNTRSLEHYQALEAIVLGVCASRVYGQNLTGDQLTERVEAYLDGMDRRVSAFECRHSDGIVSVSGCICVVVVGALHESRYT